MYVAVLADSLDPDKPPVLEMGEPDEGVAGAVANFVECIERKVSRKIWPAGLVYSDDGNLRRKEESIY